MGGTCKPKTNAKNEEIFYQCDCEEIVFPKISYDDVKFNYDDIKLDFKEDDLQLCPPVSCWNVDYSKIGSFTTKELSDGKVTEIDRFGKKRLEWSDGTKLLDRLIEVMSENCRIQYDNGRIDGNEYAKIYSEIFQKVLELGVTMSISAKELELKAAEAQRQAELIDLQKIQAKLDIKTKNLQNLVVKEQVYSARADRIAKEYQAKATIAQLALLQQQSNELVAKVALLKEQMLMTKMQTENVAEQTRLYERQREGFDDNILNKLTEFQMSNYAMMYSSGMIDDGILPEPMNKAELADIYKAMKDKATVTKRKEIEVEVEKEVIENGQKVKKKVKEKQTVREPNPKEYIIDKRINKPSSKVCL